MAHPAQTPKTRFAGTAIAAATRVSHSAESASGSRMASLYATHPLANASVKTVISGSRRKSERKTSDTAVSSQRT